MRNKIIALIYFICLAILFGISQKGIAVEQPKNLQMSAGLLMIRQQKSKNFFGII